MGARWQRVPGRSSGAAGCWGKTALRVDLMARSTGSAGLQPDSNGSNAGVPSVICSGAVRPVHRATYSRHRLGVCATGLIGWPAASASRCVQVRGTTWTRSDPPPPVSSQRPPARSWARAWIAAWAARCASMLSSRRASGSRRCVSAPPCWLTRICGRNRASSGGDDRVEGAQQGASPVPAGSATLTAEPPAPGRRSRMAGR
jgi:hypothetical protein